MYSRDDEGNRSKYRSPGRYYAGDVEIPADRYYGKKAGTASGNNGSPEEGDKQKKVEMDLSEPKNPWKALG